MGAIPLLKSKQNMNIANSLLNLSILVMEGILAFYFLAAFLPANAKTDTEIKVTPVVVSIAPLEISEAKDTTPISIDSTVLTVKQLVSIAREHKVPGYSKMKKQQLQQTLSELQICCQLQPA
jgi:Rho termination factor, N-terminal domain